MTPAASDWSAPLGFAAAPSGVTAVSRGAARRSAEQAAMSVPAASAAAARRAGRRVALGRGMAQYPRSMLNENCRTPGYGARSMNRFRFVFPKLLNSGS